MRSLLDPGTRRETMARFGRLTPGTPSQWGRMVAARRVAHLCDQMRHMLADAPVAPIPHWSRRVPFLSRIILYWVPWPKGKVEGPPEAFETPPGAWEEDLRQLEGFVERFVATDPDATWPDHPIFGRMSRRDWGVFCWRHFDHHLRQFGA